MTKNVNLLAKRPLKGHNVSHANNKTKEDFCLVLKE